MTFDWEFFIWVGVARGGGGPMSFGVYSRDIASKRSGQNCLQISKTVKLYIIFTSILLYGHFQ